MGLGSLVLALFACLFPAYFGLFWLVSSHMVLLNQPKSAGFSTSRTAPIFFPKHCFLKHYGSWPDRIWQQFTSMTIKWQVVMLPNGIWQQWPSIQWKVSVIPSRAAKTPSIFSCSYQWNLVLNIIYEILMCLWPMGPWCRRRDTLTAILQRKKKLARSQ